MRVQWAVEKLEDDKYCIWGMHIPPQAVGMNNFVGPDGGHDSQGYTQKAVIDRLTELGISEISACQLVDMADERGITK